MLRGGKAFCMLLETVDPEELGADCILRLRNGDSWPASDGREDRQYRPFPRRVCRAGAAAWNYRQRRFEDWKKLAGRLGYASSERPCVTRMGPQRHPRDPEEGGL